MTNELINAFKSSLRGKLILPADADYDAARKVYNGMIDKHPAMIAQCADVNDVQACVNFARDNDVLVSIRGGGHNAGGLGIAVGVERVGRDAAGDLEIRQQTEAGHEVVPVGAMDTVDRAAHDLAVVGDAQAAPGQQGRRRRDGQA